MIGSLFVLKIIFCLGWLNPERSYAGDSAGRVVFADSAQYDNSHWALQRMQAKEPGFIARVSFGSLRFLIRLNPTDARGYRSLVLFEAAEDHDPRTVLNRPYSLTEKAALMTVLAMLQQAYERLGLIAQVQVAGNNAHCFIKSDSDGGTTVVGTEEEPSILHGHVIARGNPVHEYVKGVPLRGPVPGELFDMRSEKTSWAENEMHEVSLALAHELHGLTNEARALGMSIDEMISCSAKLDRADP